jgi:hypothetical protein
MNLRDWLFDQIVVPTEIIWRDLDIRGKLLAFVEEYDLVLSERNRLARKLGKAERKISKLEEAGASEHLKTEAP